ncbi:glycosyl transferase [Actinomyces denticolens]|nr:glycosyl transferase [Actinomyces denticolens]
MLTNTVTIPTWPAAARLAGVPAIAHVHEAEDSQPLVIRAGLNAPLLAARAVVANSGPPGTSSCPPSPCSRTAQE